MISAKTILTTWLCVASCLALMEMAVRTADGQEESSAIFPGLTPPVQAPRGNGGHQTSVSRTAFEQSPQVSTAPVEASPTFPQIQSPLDAPPLESSGAAANLAETSSLPGSEACPECGAPLDHANAGICGRCLRPLGHIFHLLSPKRWLQATPEQIALREPWLRRPFSVGLFMGPIVGSPLINDSIQQGTGFLGGGRFGYDFDDDWGLETRLASASFPVSGDFQNDGSQHSADHFLWDIDFLYYPWGDAALRPYVLMGIGTARIKFADQWGNDQARILAGMPVGIGIKWKLSDWFVCRLECLDNVAFAGGSVFQTQHNPSLTGGLEIRFGRPHVQYWPWNPGMRQ